jgi:hypothetical protein
LTHALGVAVMAVAALVPGAFTVACSGRWAEAGDSGNDAASDAGLARVSPGDEFLLTYAPTYAAVYDEVLAQSCALAFCHAGQGDYLQITSKGQGYQALVNAPARGPQCTLTGLKRVVPGHPETSLLYLKITNPPCGSKMPLSYGDGGSLDPRQIDQIAQWIEAGALNN